MNFKNVIMNPPYGNKHLPILKKMIEETVNKNNGQVVSIQPVRWLQEDYDYKKSQKIFLNNNVEIVDSGRHLWNTFDASGTFDLAIYKINGKINNYKDHIKKSMPFFGSNKNLKWEKYNGQKYFVPCKGIISDHGNWWDNAELYKREWGYITNGKLTNGNRNGLTAEKAWENETNGKLTNWYGPKLKNANETKNFFDYLHLNAFKYYMKKYTVDIHVHLDRLPFPNDFSISWTNEKFYKYFGINEEEQKIIEDTMKHYDSKNLKEKV
jgi:hypothetical protein